MVLNQCIVKGCHSTSSVENLQVGCGGHLHPIPTEVTQDLQLEKKWIELVKGNRTLTSRQGNIRNQFICEKHFEDNDFEEIMDTSDGQNVKQDSLSRALKGNSIPTKCLPNQGGHQDENDYIYYDRDVSDKSGSILEEGSEHTKSTDISPELKKDNKGGTDKLLEVSSAVGANLSEFKLYENDIDNENNVPNATSSTKAKDTKNDSTTNHSSVIMSSTNLSITPSFPIKTNLESRVKTVVARDKATGKKVLMKLMPVGVGVGKNISPSFGASAIVKTISSADRKNTTGRKRPFNFSAKSQAMNRSNIMTLNSRLLIRPHEFAVHPNSNLPPNAARQAANHVRQQFKISTNKKISAPKLMKQPVEPTPLKNPSLLYNELGLSNVTIGSNGENKSKADDEKRLLRHVDSVIETIMDETRLSEGEGELSKVLRGQSQPTGEESTVEFPEGEVPADAVHLATSSLKENDEKSKSPVRFIKSSDGTIKISSVINSPARNLQPQLERKITMTPKGPLLMRRELGAQGPILIRKGTDGEDNKADDDKGINVSVGITESSKVKDQQSTDNDIKLDASQQSMSKQMSFSNRIVMNQLENPRELGNLPNLTALPKYQLETASRIIGVNSGLATETGGESTLGNLELEAKRHQQIHMLIKLARLWMNKANDLELVNARLSAGWKDAGMNPGFLEVATDKALVYWRHKAMTLNAENLTLKKELVAFIRSKGDINDETAKRYRTENSNLRSKLGARERQYKKVEKLQIKQKDTVSKLRKDLSAEIKERGALLRRKRNRDRRVEVNAARRRWRAQVMKELVNQNKLHPDVLKRPRIFYPPYIGQKYVDAEGNPLPKPKPFANWNKKKGVESGKLVEDIRDLPPEAFQQHQLQQQQFIISSPHKLVTKDTIDGEVLLAKSETDIAVASITAAGIVPGVVTIGNQQITVEGAAVGASTEGHFGGVVSVEAQVAANAQYHVNQLNEELLRGGEISSNLKSAVQDAIHRMEAGNYSGNNVKNRPYRWQGKGPRPPHKQPPPKKSKKMIQFEDTTVVEVDGDKLSKSKMKKSKTKAPKIAYSTTLKKVDTRTVSNNVATTSNSIHRIQPSDLSQHSYITTHPQQVRIRKNRRKRGNNVAGKAIVGGESDEDLVGDSDSDVSASYGEHSEQSTQQQQVFQQIVPQHLVQEVIATGQSANMDGVGLVGTGGGLNLIPQIGQVQYIQDTENGQIIHYQLHDQYGQILQQDPGQTQVIVTTQEGVPQEIPYQHIVTTTQQDTTNTGGIYNVPFSEASTSGGTTVDNNEAQQITQTVLRQNDGDVLMSFSVPYKVETTSNVGAASSSDTNDWQTTTVTIPSQQSPQQ